MNKYTNLIPSEYQTSTKFLKLVELLTSVLESNTNLLNRHDLYDVDICTGFELDYIGYWVGLSRNLNSPITGTLFSFDDSGLGFDRGYFQEQYSPTGILRLPDDLLRQILKAKIYSNHWNGTIPDAQIALQKLFPNNEVIIQDNQDMSLSIGLLKPIDAVTKALIDAGLLNTIKPAGVLLNWMTNSIFFSFDLNSSTQKGFDLGYF